VAAPPLRRSCRHHRRRAGVREPAALVPGALFFTRKVPSVRDDRTLDKPYANERPGAMGMSGSDAVHLVVAVALTYLLGFERDLRGATAGDRVFALVGAGAGVVGIIAEHGAPNVLAGAITGIGFIGAGLVFRQAFGSQQVVMGITTAAAIFAAAAVGAAAGQGRLLVAAVATALSLFVLEIRHVRWLRVLDGQRWARFFPNDEPMQPDKPPED
jgi:putative Mg2+ transporter-C (MgtC) family protein